MLMVVYHTFIDLVLLDYGYWALTSGEWLVMARVIQFLFLSLVGVSIVLSSRNFMGQLTRALKILLGAALL